MRSFPIVALALFLVSAPDYRAGADDRDATPLPRPLTAAEVMGIEAARGDPSPEVRAMAGMVLIRTGFNADGEFNLVHPEEPRAALPTVRRVETPSSTRIEAVPPMANSSPQPTPEERAQEYAKTASELKTADTESLLFLLGRLRTPAARAHAAEVAPFVRDKKDKAGWVGRDAALTLAAMGAREFADDLVAAVPEVRTQEARYGIMRALEQFDDLRCVDIALGLSAEEVGDFYGLGFAQSISFQNAAIAVLVRYRSARVEATLTNLLSSDSPAARLGGIRALRALQVVDAVPAIARLIVPDQPPGIRSYAIQALADLGGKEFAPQIARELDGYQPVTRAPLAPELYERLELQSPVITPGEAAVLALADFGAAEFIPQIAAVLKYEPVQHEAMASLVKLKSRQSAAQIAAVMLDPATSSSGRKTALGALVQLNARDQAGVIVRLIQPAAQSDIDYGSEDERDELGVLAVNALSEIAPDTLRKILPALLTEEGMPETKSRVLFLLKDLGAAPFLDLIEGLLLEKESASVRLHAACLLHYMKVMDPGEVMTFLARVVRDGMWWSQIKDKFLDPWKMNPEDGSVVPMLQHPEADVVVGGLQILRHLEKKAPMELLIPLLQPARRDDVRQAALAALCDWSTDEDMNAVAALLTDSDQKIAALAAQSIARHGSSTQAPALAAVVSHESGLIRKEARHALIQVGGALPLKELPALINAAVREPNERAAWIFVAYQFFAREAHLAPAIPYLGGRDSDESPPVPDNPAQARIVLNALTEFCTLADPREHEQALWDAATVAQKIVRTASWEYSDAPWLNSLAGAWRSIESLKKPAAEVQTLAEAMADRHPLRRALWAAVWTLVIQILIWLLVLLIYPWSRLAQWMLWTRWVRRWMGFGWVEPLVLHVPWLRERMWRPFREMLVPPGEIVSFDEWTFFDAVRLTPPGGGEAQPALRTLEPLQGIVVLRGESGLGKTTLLQALAGRAQRPVALLRAAECHEGLLPALRTRLPRYARRDAAFLRSLVLRGSPDIFVDAVHEAPPEVCARLTEEVNTFAGARILLTTQPVVWTPPQGAAEWQLEPLRAQDIAPFLLKQGAAAVEAAGSGSLAERRRNFAAHTAAFLEHFQKLPPESTEAAALRRMLANPMEAVLAAELLAAGQTPDPARLLEQRMEHLADDYVTQCGDKFPAQEFAEHLRSWRDSGAPFLHLDVFSGVASFLARHRLLRKTAGDREAWRFRHDKIMEWFLRAAA